jgi:hypothetical protein
MHERTNIRLSAANRSELEVVVTKPHLAGEDCALMADGHGTAEIMRATGVSSVQRVWRAHGLRPPAYSAPPKELKHAVHRFLDDANANPKPFTWTKDPTSSLP